MNEVLGEVYERAQGGRVKFTDRNRREYLLDQLLFADDTVVVADSAENLQCLLTEFGRVDTSRKLNLNVKKKQGFGVRKGRDCTQTGS